jgi:hypothetical protein
MFESVIKAKHIENYRVWIAFDDGKEGEIDLSQNLRNKDEGSVFKPLKDISYFKKFQIENDTLSWENGADFAPEFLHELLIKQNKNKN